MIKPGVVILCGTMIGVSLAVGVCARPLSLRAALRYALRHNPSIRLAAAQQTGANAAAAEAKAARLPRIGVSYSYSASTNPLMALTAGLERRQITTSSFAPALLNNPGVTTLGTAAVTATMPIYTNGHIAALERAGRDAQHGAAFGMRQSRQDIVRAVLQSYYGVLGAQAALHIARGARTIAARHLRTARELYKQGRILHADMLTAAVNVAANQAFYEQAQENLHAARVALRLALGADPAMPLVISPVPLQTPTLSQRPVNALVARALAHRSDLQALLINARREHAEALAAADRSGLQFDVSASENWYSQVPALRHNAWSVMGIVRASLYDGGGTSDHAAILDARAQALTDRAQALRNHITYEIETATNAMRWAQTRYRTATKEVQQARQAAQLIRRRYGEGRVPMIELLEIDHDLVEARDSRLGALLAMLNSAIALRSAEGTLSAHRLAFLDH
ncbi:MAG: TolC family protein [Acidiferrobacter sp.]